MFLSILLKLSFPIFYFFKAAPVNKYGQETSFFCFLKHVKVKFFNNVWDVRRLLKRLFPVKGFLKALTLKIYKQPFVDDLSAIFRGLVEHFLTICILLIILFNEKASFSKNCCVHGLLVAQTLTLSRSLLAFVNYWYGHEQLKSFKHHPQRALH